MEPAVDKKKELRKFGYLMGVSIPVLFSGLFPLLLGTKIKLWPILVGAILLVTAFSKPRLLIYPHKAWITVGDFLGYIKTRIMLGIVFFTIFLPVGLVMRILKYDPMSRTFDQELKSYRYVRKSKVRSKLENPY